MANPCCGFWHGPDETCGRDTGLGLARKARLEAGRRIGGVKLASEEVGVLDWLGPSAAEGERSRSPGPRTDGRLDPQPDTPAGPRVVSSGAKVSAPVKKGKGGRPGKHADRAAYMREYMRGWRARVKASGDCA